MKWKPKFRVRYFVSEEKRTVVCVIDEVDDVLWDFCDEFGGQLSTDGKVNSHKWLEPRYVGKAVCSPDDEWDESLGRLIAYRRAREKFDYSFFRHAQDYITKVGQELDQFVDMVNTFGNHEADAAAYWQDRIAQKLKD